MASIASTTHCCAELLGQLVDQLRPRDRGGVDDTLSAPASSTACASSTERIPPPIVNGMKTSSAVRRASSTTVSRLSVRRGDVEEDELVGARRVVARRQLDRVARVAQVDEAGALDDAPAVDVEARDDALGVHSPTDGSAGGRLAPARLRRGHCLRFGLPAASSLSAARASAT